MSRDYLGYGNLLSRKKLMEIWNISEARMQKLEAEGFTDIALYRRSDINVYMMSKGIKGLEKISNHSVHIKDVVKHKPEGTILRCELCQKLGIDYNALCRLERLGLNTARYNKMLFRSDTRKNYVLYDLQKVREWLKENKRGIYDI